MTIFLRLLADDQKDQSLAEICAALRTERDDGRIFRTSFEKFSSIAGKPFAYWASDELFSHFRKGQQFQNDHRKALRTNGTTNDVRWIRAWWEVFNSEANTKIAWVPHAKGGAFSPFFSDLHLVIAWDGENHTYPGYQGTLHRPDIRPASLQYFFLPGLTWSRRNSTGLSFRVLPRGAIFGDKGPGIVFIPFDEQECLSVCGMINSAAFRYLVSLQLGTVKLAQSFEAGVIQQTPFPNIGSEVSGRMAQLSRRAWSLCRGRNIVFETSHTFLLPEFFRSRLDWLGSVSTEHELAEIQASIDEVSFELFGFGEEDRRLALGQSGPDAINFEEGVDPYENDDEEIVEDDEEQLIEELDGLLSWAIGVAFGRFDWRLATGEREAPPEPDPFDPLPAKSPGMLPDGVAPFHGHSGVLVDDQGHPHDLARLIEEVLTRVEADVPAGVRRWLERDFFPLHLKQYSKSRRKAPIYWPLSTTSGSYTLWLYYPSLTSQTLYTAVNDFVEPKLKQVSRDAAILRDKGAARTRDDEKAFEALQALELELIELRDTLLDIAPTYRPNHDDGVQITAAPLWPLFRHKPWQKVLKDTWAKLEKGDYDWAHLAMAYWPDRVREKCKTDKSLAIAHDLEDLYDPAPSTDGGKKKKKGSGA